MSKKIKTDEFDFSDGLDSPDFSFDMPGVKEDRSPAGVKVISSAASGFKSTVTSGDFIRKMVKESLPKDYSVAGDVAMQTADTVRGLYNDATKELKPLVNDIKRTTGKILPSFESVLPKSVSAKIKNWSDSGNKPGFKDLSPEEQRDASMQMQMGEIFKMQTQANLKEQGETKARESIRDVIDNSRHKDMTSQLDAMRVSLQQLAGYQTNIESNYQKKSLELQFRQFFIAQDSLEEMKRYNAVSVANLEGILKNSGLPEYAKLKTTERLKEVMRNKFIDNTLSGKGSVGGFIKSVGGNLGKVVKEKVSNFASDVKSGLDMADMVVDMQESMKEMGGGGGSATEMAGGMAGSSLGEQFGKWLSSKFKKRLGENEKVISTGKDWAHKAKNIPGMLTDYSEENTFGKEREGKVGKVISMFDEGNIFGGFGEMFREAVRTTNSVDNTLQSDKVGNMQDPSPFSRGASKAVTEVIPGYLSRIYQELQIIRSGDDKVELTTYDYNSNAFVSKSKLTTNIFESLVGRSTKETDDINAEIKRLSSKKRLTKEEKERLEYLKKSAETNKTFTSKEINDLISEVDKENKLTPDQRKILGQKLLNDSIGKKSGSSKRLGATESYTGESAKHAETYTNLFNNHFSVKDNEYSFSDKYNDLGRGIADRRKDIQDHVNTGNRDVLEELGILDVGSDNINQDKLMSYLAGLEDMPNIGVKPKTKAAANRARSSRRPKHLKHGGHVVENDPKLKGKTDTVPAMLDDGEYVLPADTVDAVGRDKLDDLKNSTHQKFADGGSVRKRNKNLHSSEAILEKISHTLLRMEKVMKESANSVFGINKKDLKDGFNKADKFVRSSITTGKAKFNKIQEDVLSSDFYKNGKLKFDKFTDEGRKQYESLSEEGKAKYNEFLKSDTYAKIKKTTSDLRNRGKEKLDIAGKAIKDFDLEKTIDNIKDIYVKGSEHPRIIAAKLKAGEYRDAATKKVISSYKDIKGSIIDEKGNIVLSFEEVKNSFIKTDSGEKLITALGAIKDKGKELYGKAAPHLDTGFSFVKNAFNKVGDKINSTLDKESNTTGESKSFSDTINDTLLRIEKKLNEGIDVFTNGEGDKTRKGGMGWNTSIKDVGKGLFGAGLKGVNIARGIGKKAFNRTFGLASKTLGLGRDLITSGTEKLADRITGIRDVYIPGENTPRMLASKIKKGDYLDKETGKVISSYKNITGAVLDEKGNIVLTAEEAKTAYVKELMGTKLLKTLGSSIKGLASMFSGTRGLVPAVFKLGVKLATKTFGLLSLPQDVYVKDKYDKPALLAKTMKSGGYTSRITGNVIKHPGDIDGAILDDKGNEVLTSEEFALGIYDSRGKPIRTGLNKLFGNAKDIAMFGLNKARKIGSGIINRAGKVIGGIGSFIKNNVRIGGGIGGLNFGNTGEGVTGDSGTANIVITRLTQIRDLVNLSLTANLRQKFNDGEGDKKLKVGVISAVGGAVKNTVNKFKRTIGGFFGKKTPEELAIINAQTNNEIKDLLKFRLPKPEKAIREGSYLDQLRRKREAKALDGKSNSAKVAGGMGISGKIMNGIKGLFGNKDSEEDGGRSITDMAEQTLMDKAGDKLLGDKGGKAAEGAAKAGGKKGLLKGALKFGGKALGLAGAAYGGYSAYDNIKKGNYGEAALDGGLAAGGLAMTAGGLGGVASLAGGIGTALAGLGAVLASPVVLGALAVAAVGVGGYMAYKYLTRKKLTTLSKIRYAQYGFKPTDEDNFKSIMELEDIVEKAVIYDKGQAGLKESKLEVKKIVDIFGVDLEKKDEVAAVIRWFNIRFKPVYLTHLTALYTIDPRKNLADVEKLDPEDKKKYITAIKFQEGPYSYNISPFPKGNPLAANKSDVVSLCDVAETELKDLIENSKNGSGISKATNTKPPIKEEKKSEEPSYFDRVKSATKDSWKFTKDVSESIGVGATVAAGNFKDISKDTINIAGNIGDSIGVGLSTAGGQAKNVLTSGGKAIGAAAAGIGGLISSIPMPTAQGSWDALRGTISAASKAVGVDEGLMATMAAIESGFNYTVKAATSSATGLYQFIDSTWKTMIRKYGDKYGIDKDTPSSDPRANSLMGAEFIKENMKALSGVVDRPLTATDIYLAHFLGAGGAKQLLKANPNAIAADLMPAPARANKSIFYNKDGSARTVAQVYAEIERRVTSRGKQFGINTGETASTRLLATAFKPGSSGIIGSKDQIVKTSNALGTPVSKTNPIGGTGMSSATMTGGVISKVNNSSDRQQDITAASSGFASPKESANITAQKKYEKDLNAESLNAMGDTLTSSLSVQKSQLDILNKIFTIINNKQSSSRINNEPEKQLPINKGIQKKAEDMPKGPVTMRKSPLLM